MDLNRTGHVAGNMRFIAVDEDTADGVTTLTVYMDDTGSTVTWVVGETHDRFVRSSEGWRFASRRRQHVFDRPAPDAQSHRDLSPRGTSVLIGTSKTTDVSNSTADGAVTST